MGHTLFIAGFCAGLGGAVTSALIDDRRRARKIYWLGWLVNAVCFSVGALTQGWQPSLGFGLLCVFVAVFYAYMRTPYVKIRGRIYAISNIDSQPDPPLGETANTEPMRTDSDPTDFGSVSAPKVWWTLVALTILVAANVYFFGWPAQAILGTAFLTLVCAAAGVDDATRKLPIARGQYVQAGIAAVVSFLLWLAPCIAYLFGYAIGQRWPMGRGKQATPPEK
ncbi:hypothetical protein [Mycobacterium shigaense]|uniref:hypothetical protein n=1 Tax=Mycobacterium shigaense TaxID=722731 RepID=UPI000BBA908B|nr:hypothetical protein [Mycobacterium shigaense]PRI13167.1 hypothetical protein B2J96_22115 [Mycobacterium shigaense]